jgi:hypothetical protein
MASLSCFSQAYILMKDGRTIDFDKIRLEPTILKVKTDDKKNIEIPVKEVYAFVSLGEILYMVPIPDIQEKYDFLERKYEGKINIYERITGTVGHTTPYGSTASTREHNLYLEKDGLVRKATVKKKERIDTLRLFVNDHPEFKAILDDEDYKTSYNNIIELLRKYNLANYTKPEKEVKPAMVKFYSRMYGDKLYTLKLTVNDSIEYEIAPKGTTMVTLDSNNHCKVCVSYEDANFCDVLIGSPYFIQNYEIEFKKHNGFLNIEKKSGAATEKYLVMQMNKELLKN